MPINKELLERIDSVSKLNDLATLLSRITPDKNNLIEVFLTEDELSAIQCDIGDAGWNTVYYSWRNYHSCHSYPNGRGCWNGMVLSVRPPVFSEAEIEQTKLRKAFDSLGKALDSYMAKAKP